LNPCQCQGGDEQHSLGDEVGPLTFGRGLDAKSDHKMRLPDARRPEQDHVLAVGDEPAFGELLDPLFVDRGLLGSIMSGRR